MWRVLPYNSSFENQQKVEKVEKVENVENVENVPSDVRRAGLTFKYPPPFEFFWWESISEPISGRLTHWLAH